MGTSLLQKLPRKLWLAPILLIVALFLPLIGERTQIDWIGDEIVCCHPDNYESLYEKAKIAQSKRPLSNFIIGGSIIIGLALASSSFIYLSYCLYYFIKKQKTRVIIVATLLLVIALYVILILGLMLKYFVAYNDSYFQHRPWLGGRLYDGAWYNPKNWL